MSDFHNTVVRAACPALLNLLKLRSPRLRNLWCYEHLRMFNSFDKTHRPFRHGICCILQNDGGMYTIYHR